jgi:hypothetical protein
MRRTPGATITGLALALALPSAARGTEVVAASPAAPHAWNLEAGISYAATTDFGGWGVALRGGWQANRYLVVGLGVETTRLHAEGTTSGTFAAPYSQTFQSTFPAVFLRGQLPFRLFTPYTEVATGVVVVHDRSAQNSQCFFGSGPGGALAIGIDAQIVPSISAGLRAEARNPGWGGGCLADAGPWSFQFQDDATMRSLALTTRFRW